MAEHAPAANMLELALAYAARGWRVFPLRGKAPEIKNGHGCLDATTDPDIIRGMWAGRRSQCNVGIATGKESGFFAVDLDGPDAKRAWMSFIGRHDPFETLAVRSGRAEGGLHIYFAWPEGGVPNQRERSDWSMRVVGHPRVGVHAEGKYVVAAGSIHPDTGMQYDWTGEATRIVQTPHWLVEAIRDERPVDPWAVPAEQPRFESTPDIEARAIRYINTMPAAISGQGGHNATFLVALKLARGFALGPDVTFRILRDHYNYRCEPPWSERQLRHKAEDAWEADAELGFIINEESETPRPKGDERESGVHTAPTPKEAPSELTAPDMAALCRELPGKHKRITTYCEPLDAATGGGFQTGRIVVIGGPPGVTKTGWALAIGYTMARLGVYTSTGHHPVHVHIIAADEPRDGLLSRLAQMEGRTRSELDDEDLSVSRPAWEHLAVRLAQVPSLTIWDPRSDPVTVEDVAAFGAARSRAAGARLVVIVDSITTAPFSSDDPKATVRERIEARMRAMRRLTVEHGACVVAISELNRGAYSGREAKADVGSFKEAGGIEYTADLAMTMARVVDPDWFLVQVTMHKSRLGDEPGFRLRKTVQCTFEVVSEDQPNPDVDISAIADEARIEKLCNEIVLALVRARGPVATRLDLAKLTRARKGDAEAAISRLITSGRIKGGRGVPFTVSSDAEETDTA